MRYAAYGSNLHPLRLRERVTHAPLLGTAVLDGFALRFHKHSRADSSAKANLADGDGMVHVAVFDIEAAARDLLDRFEGLGSGYHRVPLEVPGFGECFTYRAEPDAVDDSLRPFAWYRDLVVAGCRYHGFPLAYVDAVESVAADRDPDDARRECHEALLERLTAG